MNESERDRIVNVMREMAGALEECDEYLDRFADADCDQDGYIPNEAMQLLGEVRHALKIARRYV